jgi:hypothetical protein
MLCGKGVAQDGQVLGTRAEQTEACDERVGVQAPDRRSVALDAGPVDVA